MPVYGNSRPPFTDLNGDPILSGKLFIGLPDQDPVANPNPNVTDMDDNPISATLTLDDLGVTSIPFKISGDFSQAVFNSDNVEIPSYQQTRTGGFLQESDLVGVSGQGGDWNASITYGKDDLVRGSDGSYYKSLTASNLNNDPTVVTTSWSRLAWPTDWNTNETYDTGDSALGSNGRTYVSTIDGNTGTNPVTDTSLDWTGFRGALATTIIPDNLPTGVFTALSFELEDYDRGDWHDLVTDNERHTVIAGQTRVKLVGQVQISAAATSASLEIRKNGSVVVALTDIEQGIIMNISTPVLNVSPGDYFELLAEHNAAGAGITIPSGTFFSIEAVQ